MDSGILGLVLFSVAASITPGPNNVLLLSSGRNFGIRRTLPLMAGVFSGFSLLLILSGFGIASLIQANPGLHLLLRCVSTAWLTYLAFLVFRLGSVSNDAQIKFINFPQAFFMQFINPKAWAMAMNGASGFMPHTASTILNVSIFTAVFLGVGTFSMLAWVSAGTTLARVLQSPRANFILGLVLSLLVLVSIVTIWI